MAAPNTDRPTPTTSSGYDAFLAVCPSRQLLDQISSKWVTLVLCALAGDDTATDPSQHGSGQPLRYSELARRIDGVSQKMLTQTLRTLERDGLLTRTVTPTVPVTVTYELTDLGDSLLDVISRIRVWAEANMDDVTRQRAAYDARQAELRPHRIRTPSQSRAPRTRP